MKRTDIINIIGKQYLVSNHESDEFSYKKEFKTKNKNVENYKLQKTKRNHERIDIRFVHNNVSILVETKRDYTKDKNVFSQLQQYVEYEKALTGNKIIALVCNTDNDFNLLWYGNNPTILEENAEKATNIFSFADYEKLFKNQINDKNHVIKSTYALNELLHTFNINEKIRSQFVGTCLLALKNNLSYAETSDTNQIIAGIITILEKLLNNDINKAEKLVTLNKNVLETQDIKSLKSEEFCQILDYIKSNIIPYIMDETTMGQDILNLFFTTFNKYVGKADKNQAFTPDHIVKFICSVVGINKDSKVLDPCCGSGAFLVRALTDALDSCSTEDEKEKVKKENIYGIEYDNVPFGLATTNMLIHGDGNSNIKQGNCFDNVEFIKNADINVVLMNPPYNANKKTCRKEFTDTWSAKTKSDPSKGFDFVHFIAETIKKGKIAVLLPVACAVGSNSAIVSIKKQMLVNHTLDAVFSLPYDIFYPGANANVVCMIFELGVPHEESNKKTFLGRFTEDGFKKKKNLGRVEMEDENGDSLWQNYLNEWLRLYKNREEKENISICKKLTGDDEWIAEAYITPIYEDLKEEDFEKSIREFIAYEVKYEE